MWDCAVCGRDAPRPLRCQGCGAMVYCSARHAETHLRTLGHGEECERMRDQMASGAALADAGVSYLPAGAFARGLAVPPTDSEACSVLEHLQVHEKGLFSLLCACRCSGAPAGARVLLGWQPAFDWRRIACRACFCPHACTRPRLGDDTPAFDGGES